MDLIKETAGEYIQINEFEQALIIIEKCISEFSFEEKGRWEEVKALMMFYSDSKNAEMQNKKIEFNENINILFQK